MPRIDVLRIPCLFSSQPVGLRVSNHGALFCKFHIIYHIGQRKLEDGGLAVEN